MTKLSILIPSYKRPSVLLNTLEGVSNTLRNSSDFDIGVYIGLNKVTSDTLCVAEKFKKVFYDLGIKYEFLLYKDNEGKAFVLNDLFDKFAKHYDYVITMDNDMYLKLPWLDLVKSAITIDFDILGFGSPAFWAHVPPKEITEFFEISNYKIYKSLGIAGGIMLFPKSFLIKNPWTNMGGVYGIDDAQMCLKTSKKYVIYWERDWLEHDPLAKSLPDLKDYHERKEKFIKQNIYVLQKGWDE